MAITQVRPWGLDKPPPGYQFNFAHPSLQGLQAGWLLNEYGLNPLEALSGVAGVQASGTTAPVWNDTAPDIGLVNNFNPSLNFPSGTHQLNYAGSGFAWTASIPTTIFGLFYVNDAAGTGRWISTNSTDTGFSIGQISSHFCVIYNGSAYGFAGPACTTGHWFGLVGVHVSAAAARFYAWDYNAATYSKVTGAGATGTTGGNTTASINLRSDNGNFRISLGGIIRGLWTDEDVWEFFQAPWSLLQPRARRWGGSAAAPAADTFPAYFSRPNYEELVYEDLTY